jgi:hypothetical protein
MRSSNFLTLDLNDLKLLGPRLVHELSSMSKTNCLFGTFKHDDQKNVDQQKDFDEGNHLKSFDKNLDQELSLKKYSDWEEELEELYGQGYKISKSYTRAEAYAKKSLQVAADNQVLLESLLKKIDKENL